MTVDDPGTFTRTCARPDCGATFTTTNVRKRYCSTACRSADHHARVATDAVNVRVRAARAALYALAEVADTAGPDAWNDAWDQIRAEMDHITRTFPEKDRS